MTRRAADNTQWESAPEARADFPSTHWTLVERVTQGGAMGQAAIEELCRRYWYPTYVFLRRRGYPQHDAEDFTQGFFLKLLEDDSLSAVDSGKGRLRTYLLQHLKRHLADQKRAIGALKRGGGVNLVSLDVLRAEDRYALEPQDERDPERLYTRAWVNELLAGVREKLRADFEAAKRPNAFDVLRPFLLLDDDPPSYREVAVQLRATDVSVRLMVHRLRSKFRDLLREEVARTVDTPDEIVAELDWIKSVLATG